ncbi:MAG: UDPGP type 1 family protein, partial [Planctomycetes bacterium]|nr:UDPGP type 1 family protein [Planctomycetota bacterium]
MDIQQRYEKARRLLDSHNQSHLLKFWGELDVTQRKKLLTRIENLDFENIDCWIEKYVKNSSTPLIPTNISPAPVYPATAADARQQLEYDKATETGKQLLASGKVAAFIVAGGQGTRLGYDGPKGNFPVSPIRKKTLFRIFAETILAAEKKYNHHLAWYIMTSPINHAATMKIFERNDYFGLNRKNVFVFQQGTMPNFDLNSKILLSAKDNIACSPDGHGGSLRALYTSGALE